MKLHDEAERPYLNPCLLFNIAFVGFTFITFATILLIDHGGLDQAVEMSGGDGFEMF